MTFAINKLPLSPFAKSYYQSKLEFMEKTEFFVCKCHDVSHQLVLETLETEENEEHVVYGCFHIVHLEFWEKLKCAMKYIFGRSARMAISTPCCCVPKMPTDWNGLPTIWMIAFLLPTSRPILFVSHSSAQTMCMKSPSRPFKTSSKTEAY